MKNEGKTLLKSDCGISHFKNEFFLLKRSFELMGWYNSGSFAPLCLHWIKASYLREAQGCYKESKNIARRQLKFRVFNKILNVIN